jgi:hypothetical protein
MPDLNRWLPSPGLVAGPMTVSRSPVTPGDGWASIGATAQRRRSVFGLKAAQPSGFLSQRREMSPAAPQPPTTDHRPPTTDHRPQRDPEVQSAPLDDGDPAASGPRPREHPQSPNSGHAVRQRGGQGRASEGGYQPDGPDGQGAQRPALQRSRLGTMPGSCPVCRVCPSPWTSRFAHHPRHWLLRCVDCLALVHFFSVDGVGIGAWPGPTTGCPAASVSSPRLEPVGEEKQHRHPSVRPGAVVIPAQELPLLTRPGHAPGVDVAVVHGGRPGLQPQALAWRPDPCARHHQAPTDNGAAPITPVSLRVLGSAAGAGAMKPAFKAYRSPSAFFKNDRQGRFIAQRRRAAPTCAPSCRRRATCRRDHHDKNHLCDQPEQHSHGHRGHRCGHAAPGLRRWPSHRVM